MRQLISATLKSKYEEVIGHFADAVYEMTNGGHRIRNVRIYTDNKFANFADVHWIDKRGATGGNGPASLVNGFTVGKLGRNITMVDKLTSDTYTFDIEATDALDRKIAGYALAHEWGHYAYSLGDDTKLAGIITDQGWISIMDGGCILDRTTYSSSYYGYLNLPASYGGYGGPGFSSNPYALPTSNFAMWLRAPWLNFQLDPSVDWMGPHYGVERPVNRTHYSADDMWKAIGETPRVTYSALKDHIPLLTDVWTSPGGVQFSSVKIDLPSINARNNLQITWMENKLDVCIFIDRDGVMVYGSNPPWDVMTKNISTFLDVLYADATMANTQVYVEIATQDMAGTITQTIHSRSLLTTTSIATMKTAVDAVYPGSLVWGSHMYNAATNGYTILNANYSPSKMHSLILFSNGPGGVPNNPAIAESFRNKNIPIYFFSAYDPTTSLCEHTQDFINLAQETRGHYYNIYDNAADDPTGNLAKNLINTVSSTADVQPLASGSNFIVPGMQFLIDTTVSSVSIQSSYSLTDASSSISFSVEDEYGNNVPATINTIVQNPIYPRNELALIGISPSTVSSTNPGTWRLNVTSSGVVDSKIRAEVKAMGKASGTYSANASDLGNGTHMYPDPIHFRASVVKDGLIANLNVNATITSPSGVITPIAINDNGLNADGLANDGIYSADLVGYSELGEYTFDVYFNNSSGTAFLAIAGVQTELDPDTVYVTDNFMRKQTVKVQVTNPTFGTMGFEDANQWSFVSGSGTLLNQQSLKTEGLTSMEITGNGWQQLSSAPVNTKRFVGVTNQVKFDLYIGNTQPNPWWVGEVQLIVNCPSAGIYNQYIGNKSLTSLPRNAFSALTFTLPSNVINALNGDFNDFQFSIALNTNYGSGPYYIDNMRF